MKHSTCKVLIGVLVAIVAVVIGFFAFNSYIYNEKQGDGSEVARYRGTLTGEHVCLPHANTEGPHTMECALGIKTDTGEYYALDFSTMSQMGTDLQSGDRFTANGVITPIELLSTDHWQKYAIQGIFSVTDSVQKH